MNEPVSMRHAPSSLRAAPRRPSFLRDEDGSMIVFALFLFVPMLVLGGMAVDLMRFETTRSRLQEVCDRAVLAAVDLRQTENAETVVRAYFRTAGLGGEVTAVDVEQTPNGRTVSAEAKGGISTHFMRLVGVNSLEAPASCVAKDDRRNIEIVLVLDVSGSMRDNNRLVNLRAAAREFVRIVRENDAENRVSIAIVPFDAQVNLSERLLRSYNVTEPHGNSHCIELPPSVYASPGLSTTLAMPQAGLFDPNSTTSQVDDHVAPQVMRPARAPCKPLAGNEVLLPIQDVATLQARIDGLVFGEGTAITLGMKWGLALLDPGSRGVFADAIAARAMPGPLSGRPYDYGIQNTLKVVVLMTDGEHSESERLQTDFRTEPSNIWRAGTGPTATYSAHFDQVGTNLDYWVPSVDGNPNRSGVNGTWMAAPHNDIDTDGTGPDTDTDGTGPAVQLRWPEVWSSVRMSWVAWTLYARPLCPAGGENRSCRTPTYDRWMSNSSGNFKTSPSADDMDATLQQSCNLARENGVVVYGIAFEAPTRGQAQIRTCATEPAFFFNAQGLEIRTAFQQIAGQIVALRLTQ